MMGAEARRAVHASTSKIDSVNSNLADRPHHLSGRSFLELVKLSGPYLV